MNQAVKRLFTGLAAFAMIIGTGISPIAQVLAEETPAPTETSTPAPTETPVTETSEPAPSVVPTETPATPVPSTTPEVTTSAEQAGISTNAVVDDHTNPVVEKIELVGNGEEFTTDDTVRINVYAYDADSGVASGYLHLTSEHSGTYSSFALEKGSEGNQYYVEIPLTDYLPGEYYISSGQVMDNNTNITPFEGLYDYSSGAANPHVYYFTVADDLDNSVKSITFDRNGDAFESDASFNDLGITVETNEAFGKGSYIELIFTSGTDFNAPYRRFRLNSTDEEGSTFGDAFSIYSFDPSESGEYEYVLSSVRVFKGIGSYDLTMEDMDKNTFFWNYVAEESEESTFDVTVSSVELSHQGEFVKAGDVIDITVRAEANEPLRDQAFLEFHSAKTDISPNTYLVTLNYDEETGTYKGQWTIEEDRYSCEWFAYELRFNTADYNDWYYAYSPSGLPDYIRVKSGDTYSDPVRDIDIIVYTFDQTSWSFTETQRTTVKDVSRRETFKDIGFTLPEMSSPTKGMNQTGWSMNGASITGDEMLPFDGDRVAIYAMYDKAPYYSVYYYRNAEGKLSTEFYYGLIDQGSTYAMLKEQIQAHRPDDMASDYTFTEWTINGGIFGGDNAIVRPTDVSNCSAYANYSEAKMVRLYSMYYDSEGCKVFPINAEPDSVALMVDFDATYEDVVAAADAIQPTEAYAGLNLVDWEYFGSEDGVFEPGASLTRYAVYDKGLVRIQLYKGSVDIENLIYSSNAIMDGGSEYSLPSEINGYNREDVDWMIYPGTLDGVTIGTGCGDNYFIGIIDPETDVPSVDPSDPSDPDIPAVRPDEGTVNNTINEIVNAGDGETITVEMGDATVLPREVLEAAKGKDVTIVLQMNGYTWTINGKDIVATTLKDINMGVMMDSGAIPSGVVNELAGNNPTRQITLAHEGDFGFRANLTINVGAEHAGKVGNLFYYSSDNRMIFMSDPTVAADGSVTFPFSHASSYVIVLSDASMRPASDKEETGVYNSTLPYVVAIIVSAVAVGYVLKKRHA